MHVWAHVKRSCGADEHARWWIVFAHLSCGLKFTLKFKGATTQLPIIKQKLISINDVHIYKYVCIYINIYVWFADNVYCICVRTGSSQLCWHNGYRHTPVFGKIVHSESQEMLFLYVIFIWSTCCATPPCSMLHYILYAPYIIYMLSPCRFVCLCCLTSMNFTARTAMTRRSFVDTLMRHIYAYVGVCVCVCYLPCKRMCHFVSICVCVCVALSGFVDWYYTWMVVKHWSWCWIECSSERKKCHRSSKTKSARNAENCNEGECVIHISF